MLTREEYTKNNFTGSSLYKYAPVTSWDYFFKAWTLRFTPAKDLNDPYECLPVIRFDPTTRLDREKCKQFLSGDSFDSLYAMAKAAHPLPPSPYDQVMLNSLRANPEFLCDLFEQSPDFSKYIAEKALPLLRKSIGILCLTEKFDNILMWAHYGNAHNGFVIELNAQHNFFKNSLIPVMYSDTRPTLSFQEAANHQYDLYTKSKHWSYEAEWRSLAFLEANRGKKFIDVAQGTVDLPKSMVKQIIFGANVDDDIVCEKISEIRSQADCQHIRFKKMVLDDTFFELKGKVLKY